VQDDLNRLIEVRRADYDAHFAHVEHRMAIATYPDARVRLHYVRHDASGRCRFEELARKLVNYITLYCYSASRRQDLHEVDRNELFQKAKDLFRKCDTSGQVGEILIYFLLEAVLGAPQALKKMPITTNPAEERKGGDGVHLRWDDADQVLELIFAESKVWQSFQAALSNAFQSMDAFHSARASAQEIDLFTASFVSLPEKTRDAVVSFIDGENVGKSRLVQACLIGFDWNEYACLDDHRREMFLAHFEDHYRCWAEEHAQTSISEKLEKFKHRHLRFEFFLLPFRDVAEFRKWFLKELGAGA
jgi:hypothetical protein